MLNDLIEDASENLLLEPGNSKYRWLRAVLYSASNVYTKALEDLEIYIKDNPDDQKAYFLRSHAHLYLDDFDKAKQDYLRAIKIEFQGDKEFVDGHTEAVISESGMVDGDEYTTIKKIVDFEKLKALMDVKAALDKEK